MNGKEIRWKQRFYNFEKAFLQFTDAVKQVDVLSDLEKEGLVQRFEYTFELAWKTMKDFLEGQDVEVRFPRDTIKKGFQYEIISEGEVWLEMLESRNIMAHTNEEKLFQTAVNKIIADFYPEIRKLYNYFKNRK
ncbi:MAG: nucleotidyltransferase substrate binding protein [Prolixibacteraceae bacterium]